MKSLAAFAAAALLALATPAQASPSIYINLGGGGCYRPPVVCQPVIVCYPVAQWNCARWNYGPWWGTQPWIVSGYSVVSTRPAPSLAPEGTFRVPPPLRTSSPGATFSWRR